VDGEAEPQKPQKPQEQIQKTREGREALLISKIVERLNRTFREGSLRTMRTRWTLEHEVPPQKVDGRGGE